MKAPPGPGRWRLFLVLAVGLTAISFGSILVKLAQEAPFLTVSFYRMFWASVVLTPVYWLGPGRSADSTGQVNGTATASWWVVAGLALALHFTFWIASLYYTTVAVSVLLVSTSPVAAAALSFLFFGERLTPMGVLGILLSLFGVTILLRGDLTTLGDWRGGFLAVLGAVMFGFYLIAGKKIRRTRNLVAYVYPTYVLAAIFLSLLVVAGRLPLLGFAPSTHIYLILLGILPQCVGHTSYNWALKHLPATIVATLTVAEPVVASLLAYWLLSERVGPAVLLGGGLVAAGIITVTLWGVRVKSPP